MTRHSFFTYGFLLISLNVISQSITPSLVQLNKPVNAESFNTESILLNNKAKWLLPFSAAKGDLAKAFDTSGIYGVVNGVSIRPNLDTSNTNSVYVELASVIPWNFCRIGLGTNLTQSEVGNDDQNAKEIAFQKLTNGGGNLVLNLSRPIIALADFGIDKNSFFTLNSEILAFADIEKFNQNIYNPGWGMLSNINFDYRILNYKIGNRQEGNLVRFGLNGRWQYNIINNKYSTTNKVDPIFNNLSISSLGAYLGLAMFNIHLNYNLFNKSDVFFDNKQWQLRIEVVPVKF